MKGKSICAILAVYKSSPGLIVICGVHDEFCHWCQDVASSCPQAGAHVWSDGFLVEHQLTICDQC